MSIPPVPIPEVVESEIVYRGYFDVRIDHLRLQHGQKKSYSIVELGCEAALVLPETSDGKFVIAQEYRHPVRRWLLSLPGGRIDTSESPMEAGKRELLEETGYIAHEWKFLGSIYPLPAVTEQRLHILHAKGAHYVQPSTLEEFELVHTLVLSEKELKQRIAEGALVDGLLYTALHLRHMSLHG